MTNCQLPEQFLTLKLWNMHVALYLSSAMIERLFNSPSKAIHSKYPEKIMGINTKRWNKGQPTCVIWVDALQRLRVMPPK